MRKLLASAAIAAMMAALAPQAHADDDRGWYVHGHLGYSIDASVDVDAGDYMPPDDYMNGVITTENAAATTTSGEIDLDNDFMVAGGVGFDYGENWRAEGELSYRTNEEDNSSGDSIDALALMLNGYYDFDLGNAWSPFVGLGIGVAQIEPDGGDDDTAFAYQGLLGLGYAVNERWSVDATYRYFRSDDLEFGVNEVDYEHQAITIGARYKFITPAAPVAAAPPVEPAPPPAPPAPVCPKSEFTVYFEWDQSDLNQAAEDVIDAAAARTGECPVDGAMVIGHTDTSGSVSYNLDLSQDRASAVAEALVARGIPASLVQTAARGESEPAVATGDGVREPNNRRAAVTISFQ